jgi:hypothetical protein
MRMKQGVAIACIVSLFLLIGWGALPALGASTTKPTITHETSWYFNGATCDTKKQCVALATTAAQANPGVVQKVFPPPYDISVPASGSTAPPPPCPNIGAMQPGDFVAADGTPIFSDPCHAKVK